MNKSGPIIVIEDNENDRYFLMEVFEELNFKNEIIYFEDGESALAHLINKPIEPFIILSDMNMPQLSGLELKEKIQNNEDLRVKCIPFLFFTTSANHQHVKAFQIQGLFIKPNSLEKLSAIIKIIYEYWQECEPPNYIK